MTTASDLITPISKFVASYIEELGSTSATQNTLLFPYITLALKKLAHIAYKSRTSAVLNITTDSDQTFLIGGSAITDLYSPLRILDSTNKEIVKRTSYSSPVGWWRESSNTAIHTKGMTGNHTLMYIAYPADVTATDSTIDFPASGNLGLIYYVCAMIVESLPNAKDQATHFYNLANMHLKVAILANVDGRGVSTGGWIPSVANVDGRGVSTGGWIPSVSNVDTYFSSIK